MEVLLVYLIPLPFLKQVLDKTVSGTAVPHRPFCKDGDVLFLCVQCGSLEPA